MVKLRAFLSYSSSDKKIVGELTEYLEALGLVVFAAHDKLVLSQEWEQRIIDELRNANVFIALLSRRYHLSEWTDQEFGIAISVGLLIIPLLYRTKPYGFIKRYQYHKLYGCDIRDTVVEIGKAIVSDPRLRQRFRLNLAKALRDVSKFDFNRAIAATRLLNAIDRFTAREVNHVIYAALHNDQIWRCAALNNVHDFFHRHRSLVSRNNVAEYRKNFPDAV